jgi:WD40 repeat protein
VCQIVCAIRMFRSVSVAIICRNSLFRACICIAAMSVLLPLARAAHAYDRHNPEVVSQNQHDGEIKSLAFSSDGREVLSGSGDGTVKLWDVATGQVIRTFVAAGEETSSLRQRAYETFFESVTSVAFSPDGMRVLAGSNDHKIRLWEAATGRLLRTFTTKVMGQVRCVAFSPNGDRLVSGDDYSSLKLWHVESGELLRSFDRDSDRRSVVSRLWFSIKKQTYDVATCAFAPDGGHVLAGGDDKTLKLWDISTGSVVSTFSGHAAGISSVAFSSDGRRILSSSRDGTLRLWDTATGWNLRNLSEGADPIWSAALSADATRAVSGHGQGAVRLWDVTTGKVIRAFQRQSTGIISVAISPNGMTLSSASLDERTPILRTATGDVARKFGSDVNRVYAVAFSPKGTQIASGGYDKVLRLWDAASGQLVRSFSGHSWRISSVAFSPDGKRLLSGSGDKTLKLWDVASGQLLRTMEGHKDQVDSVAFSPDGTRILSSGWDRQLKLWDVATGEVVRSTSGHSFRDSAIAVSPSGLEVVSGFDESALLWDPTTGRELRTFSGHSRSTTGHTQGVTALAFSPDGRAVLSGSWDRTLKLWDVATSQPILTVQAHAGGISSVAFSSDGTRLLSASHDGTIKLWDKTSGALLRTFRGHFGAVHSATFSPNGRYIVSAGADGTIKIWDTETGTQIVSLVAGGTQDWLSITPQGFFTRSREGSELLAVVRGVEVTRIDQVHQSLFNPDLVRMALAGDPGGESREAAKLVNLDKVLDSGPAPDVAILGAASAGTSDEGLVNVEASITEKGKGIGRIEWRVNGVTAAVGTRPKGPGPDYRVLQALALDPGDNIIEVVAYNGSNLLASRPARTSIKFSGPADAVKPKLHIVTIGINAYADHGWKLAGQSQTLAFAPSSSPSTMPKRLGRG